MIALGRMSNSAWMYFSSTCSSTVLVPKVLTWTPTGWATPMA